MWILLVFLSFKGFSQTDTNKICIESQTAKLVIKDLIKGDGCQQELNQVYIKLGKVEQREAQKDTAIQVLKEKDLNNQFIISQKDSQIVELKNLSKDLEIELTQNKNEVKWWKRGTIAGGSLSLILIIILL